tara:strand:- start:17504 stop:17719 length:216 start_codon:yes stop_codon:yes gene_type:complete
MIDFNSQLDLALAKKKELEDLVNHSKNILGASIENKEDAEFLKEALDNALKGKDIDVKALTERFKNMSKNS